MPRDYVRKRPSPNNRSGKRTGSSGVVWLLAGIFIGLIMAGIFYVKDHPRLQSQLQTQIQTQSPAQTQTQTGDSAPNIPVPVVKSVPAKISETGAKKTSGQNTQNLQTQFDFYNVLPSQKVIGPSGEEDPNAIQPDASSAVQNTQPAQTAQNTQNTSQSSPSIQPIPIQPPAQSQQTATPSTLAVQAMPAKPESYILQAGIFSQYAQADRLKAELILLGFDAKISAVPHSKNGKTLQRVWLGPFHSSDAAESMQQQLKDNAISARLLKS